MICIQSLKYFIWTDMTNKITLHRTIPRWYDMATMKRTCFTPSFAPFVVQPRIKPSLRLRHKRDLGVLAWSHGFVLWTNPTASRYKLTPSVQNCLPRPRRRTRFPKLSRLRRSSSDINPFRRAWRYLLYKFSFNHLLIIIAFFEKAMNSTEVKF